MDRSNLPGSDRWIKDTQKSFDYVAKVKKPFRDQAQALLAEERGSSSRGAARSSKKKKPSYEVIGKMRLLGKTGKKLKNAKETLDAQLATEARRQCQPLCAVLHEKLPRELRAMVYHHLIEERNATFYDSPDGKVKLVKGSSTLSHCFDADYTGATMHLEMLEELKHLGIRFDFRHRHSLIKTAFDYYQSAYGFDLALVASTVGLVLNSSDITGRDQASAQLSELKRLAKGSNIYVFVQASGRTTDAIARSFRRVIRATISTLVNTRSLGHQVTVVTNPHYTLSPVRNSAGSQFSVISDQPFRLCTILGADACVVDIETV